MKNEALLLFLISPLSLFAANIPNQGLSPREQVQLQKRIHNFYNGSFCSEKMFYRPQKFSALSGEALQVHEDLKSAKQSPPRSSLEFLAQKKTDQQFLQNQCMWLKKRFPQLHCDSPEVTNTWESISPMERIESLTESWLDVPQTSIEAIPVSGKTQLNLWSDDYWKLKWGGISYRYGEGRFLGTYTEAIKAYFQPASWLKVLEDMSFNTVEREIEKWSPAEKYDLATNDLRFSLTNEQKQEGAAYLDQDGDIEGWMGLCHGWAAAALMAPKSTKTISLKGPSDTNIKWFPHDIRAVTTLAWANGNYPSNFVGLRCDSKKASTLSNGRIKDSECFDNNPGTFHLALANLVGIAGASFIMDAAFDYQVWNQPIVSYEFSYFNPLNPEQIEKRWEKVAVDYDEKFKSRDPFQKPLTRGRKVGRLSSYNDSKIKKIVGVVTTLTYLGEVYPLHGDRFSGESLIRVSYTYDLELEQQGDRYEIAGGEWHTNAHPDFLWVPQKGAVAKTYFDLPDLYFNGHEDPSDKLTEVAEEASRQGYPLCEVVSTLLRESSGEVQYSCR